LLLLEQECSVQSCLHQFTMAEMLSGANKFGCETCTGRQNKGTGEYICALAAFTFRQICPMYIFDIRFNLLSNK